MHSTHIDIGMDRHWIQLSILVSLCMLWTLVIPQPGLPAPAWSQSQAETNSPPLQFKADNHIISFEPRRVSLVSLDHILSLEFSGASITQPQSRTPAADHSAAAQLDEVTYSNIWPGIDAAFTVQTGVVAKSTYGVAPGAAPAQIKLNYNIPPILQEDGSLRFDYQSGQMIESAPIAWQNIDGQRSGVSVKFAIDSQGLVGFAIGAYNPSYALVIDPAYQWHTFYGGAPTFELTASCPYSGSMSYVAGYGTVPLHYNIEVISPAYAHGGEDMFVVVVDAGGYPRKAMHFGSGGNDRVNGMACNNNTIYMVGTSSAAWTGPYEEAPLFPYSGGNDITVIKLTGESTTANLTYNWHTFWGSFDNDQGKDIFLDDTSLYITGSSYSSWLGPSSQAALHSYSGGADIAAIKMSTSGGYAWHTFYGSQGDDIASGIRPGSSGSLWISATCEATWKGPGVSSNPKHAHSGGTDMAALVLTSAGAYSWHTFYGSSSNDVATSVWVNTTTGNGFLVGYSSTTWLGDSSTAPLHAYNAGSDIAVVGLSSSGVYQWHTFYGGSANDEGKSIAVNIDGSLYIAATSFANWVGPSGQAPVNAYSALGDIVILKLTAAGAYTWHGFYGSDAQDSANDLIIHGGPILSGYSQGTWDGPSGQLPKSPYHTSLQAAVLLRFDSSSNYLSHFFLDAEMDDTANNLTIDANNNFILVGSSQSTWRGPANQLPLHAYSGGSDDTFILKLSSTGNYLWHTFYGGSGWDDGNDVATDSAGNIYVSGASIETWNGVSATPPINPYNHAAEIYVLKLNSAGAYQWHTFLGGSSTDTPNGITVTPAGLVYVTGASYATWSGPLPTAAAPKHAYSGGADIFVLALNTSGAYLWHTFYGSATNDFGTELVEKSNNLYITGYSPNWSAPAAPLNSHNGSAANLFILKLSNAGVYGWHTFYGSDAYGFDIAIDSSSNLYIAASNKGNWNGPTGQLPTHPWSEFAMVLLKLNSSGGYLWHGFFGGSNSAMSPHIALDPGGSIWITTEASATWNAYNNIPPLHAFNGVRDICLLQLNANGYYKHHTYLGSSAQDESAGLVVSSTGLVGVGGYSLTPWNMQTGVNPLHAFNKATEVFVTTFVPMKDFFIPLVKK